MSVWMGIDGVLIIAAYLLGSIPSGYLAGRWLKGIDIREFGSGSTGATNVYRTVGKRAAIAVLLVDIFKGFLGIWLVRWAYGIEAIARLTPESVSAQTLMPWVVMLAGLAGVLGHSQSIWLLFSPEHKANGGKSAAISLGILLALHWPIALVALSIFIAIVATTRVVSLGSILAVGSVSVMMFATEQPLPYGLFALAGGIYVIWRHRTNIRRLLDGTEPRLGQNTQSAS